MQKKIFKTFNTNIYSKNMLGALSAWEVFVSFLNSDSTTDIRIVVDHFIAQI